MAKRILIVLILLIAVVFALAIEPDDGPRRLDERERWESVNGKRIGKG